MKTFIVFALNYTDSPEFCRKQVPHLPYAFKSDDYTEKGVICDELYIEFDSRDMVEVKHDESFAVFNRVSDMLCGVRLVNEVEGGVPYINLKTLKVFPKGWNFPHYYIDCKTGEKSEILDSKNDHDQGLKDARDILSARVTDLANQLSEMKKQRDDALNELRKAKKARKSGDCFKDALDFQKRRNQSLKDKLKNTLEILTDANQTMTGLEHQSEARLAEIKILRKACEHHTSTLEGVVSEREGLSRQLKEAEELLDAKEKSITRLCNDYNDLNARTIDKEYHDNFVAGLMLCSGFMMEKALTVHKEGVKNTLTKFELKNCGDRPPYTNGSQQLSAVITSVDNCGRRAHTKFRRMFTL